MNETVRPSALAEAIYRREVGPWALPGLSPGLVGWALVIATMIMCLATFTGWLPVLRFGAIALGSANAGANLGWNLGHNGFASIGRAQHDMGVHVTLTGVRGAIAPPPGILYL